MEQEMMMSLKKVARHAATELEKLAQKPGWSMSDFDAMEKLLCCCEKCAKIEQLANGGGGFFACAHGKDYRSAPTHDIPTGKYCLT